MKGAITVDGTLGNSHLATLADALHKMTDRKNEENVLKEFSISYPNETPVYHSNWKLGMVKP